MNNLRLPEPHVRVDDAFAVLVTRLQTFSWVPKAMQVIGRGFRIERERERRDSQAKKGMRAMAGVAPNGNK
jgi:hypothetical protein